jgi:cell wall-associated NlpC family hydrolase
MIVWSARSERTRVVAQRPNGAVERHAFATAEEAVARAAFVTEALSWFGTPFVDCADVKGPNGAVDCAMLLVRAAVDTGRLAPFDPRPYSPRWHLHRSEEKFVAWVEQLGARQVETPRVGDIVLWRFGRVFSHGAVLINSEEVVHAYYAAGKVLVSRLDEPLLTHISDGRVNIPRPVQYFDLWSA